MCPCMLDTQQIEQALKTASGLIVGKKEITDVELPKEQCAEWVMWLMLRMICAFSFAYDEIRFSLDEKNLKCMNNCEMLYLVVRL